MPKRIVPIKYTSREFDSIKSSLVDYVKRYYPNTFKDFSEASFGSLMLDTVSYIGDVLSFYLDYQANESFLDTAVEYNNIIRLGKQFGYKFKGNPSSYGTATFYILVPSDNTGAPNGLYMPTLKKDSQFRSRSGANFILDEDVNFKNSNEIRVARVDTGGLPTAYAVKAQGRVVSGMLSEESVEVSTHQKFLKISLGTFDVGEIMSITDDEGHSYYEVDHLSQDIIYKTVANRDDDTNNDASAILKPFMVPRRFVVEREKNTTYIQFGGGSDVEFDSDNAINPSVVDPSNVVLKRQGAPYITDSSLDPYKLISSDEFGIAPSDTTLRVVMRINTMDNVNISAGTLDKIQEATFEFSDKQATDANERAAVQQSLEITNEGQIVGDVTLPDSEELKRRILDSFATQNRAVTTKDYEAMSYAMPPQLGAVKRCKIIRDHDSLKRNLNMYIVSESSTGGLIKSNDIIKDNLKTWLSKNKMVSDTIDILDAKIINIAVDYEAVGRADVSKFETIEAANAALRKHFARLPEIGEPFWITDVYKVLKEIDGIVDVTNVNVVLKVGDGYSNVSHNIAQNTSSDGRYVEIPRNCIVEIKNTNTDISGVIK